MVITTLARKIFKVIGYIFLSLIVGFTLGDPEIWFDADLAIRLGHVLYGAGEIGEEHFYDLYFYISVFTIFPITTVIYILAIKLLKKISHS